MEKSYDVIILGAGLAGLSCALNLKKKGIHSLIVEASSEVGGRVKTQTTDSDFIIDQGFQVILSSYPEFENLVDLTQLDLRYFNSGALIYNNGALELLANPVVHPESILSTFFKEKIFMKDKLLVLKLLAMCQLQRSEMPLGEKSTSTFLQEFGFSQDFIENFWRPFLAGVFLDSELRVGENFFKFLIRCFSTGRVSVPAQGMQALPKHMARQLPADSIRLGQSASSWSSSEVILAGGEKLKAKKVVCTFDSPTISTPDLFFHSVETFYLTSTQLNQVEWGKWLVLVPQKLGLGVSHFCLLSSVAETYSQGAPLLSVSVVGGKRISVDQVMREINQIAKMDLQLELIERVFVEKALPHFAAQSEGYKVVNDVIYCGDRWVSPSINGALKSGRLAAEFVVSSLGLKNQGAVDRLLDG